MDPENRIIVGSVARQDLGRWYAHLRPASGYRRMAILLAPLFLLIQAVGWFLTLKAALVAPRDLKGVCFGFVFLVPLGVMGCLMYLVQIAPRRYVYIRDGSLWRRSEVLNFRRDQQVVALDRIRSLDYGGVDNLKIRGLLVGYDQKPYLRFAILGDLTEDETMQLVEILRPEVSPQVDSAVLHGARLAKPGMLNRSAPFVVTPGIPLPDVPVYPR